MLVTESKSEHLQRKAEYIFAPSYTITMDNYQPITCSALNDTIGFVSC